MSDLVWLHAHVEQMSDTDEYTSMDRKEWEQMSETEQDEALTSFALDAMNNAGGCGASVVEEAEVPDEWREI